MIKQYTYLALGDSYTIGEQVPLHDSFPYIATQLLRDEFNFCAPEIIAKTGWTTDELYEKIIQTKLFTQYDFVSLLIGVNNQYRERSAESFLPEFDQLLKTALRLTGEDAKRVIVLSIPDWGQTPFAEGRDREKISREIDEFNAICKRKAEEYHCNFLDITSSQRVDAKDEKYLAEDKLHPSVLEYAKWANLLADEIKASLVAGI